MFFTNSLGGTFDKIALVLNVFLLVREQLVFASAILKHLVILLVY